MSHASWHVSCVEDGSELPQTGYLHQDSGVPRAFRDDQGIPPAPTLFYLPLPPGGYFTVTCHSLSSTSSLGRQENPTAFCVTQIAVLFSGLVGCSVKDCCCFCLFSIFLLMVLPFCDSLPNICHHISQSFKNKTLNQSGGEVIWVLS